jgi:hypothetical protein
MSQLDQIAPGGVINLDKSPAALDDATFDSLFPADGTSSVLQPVQQVAQTAQPDKTQQTQQIQQTQSDATQTQQTDNDFFLKGEHSVYKTREDSVRGINEKDAVIEQLRQRYALTTGIDPITGKPVVATGQPQAETDYFNNPAQYLDDLYNAAKKGGPEAYRDVQAKFIFDAVKPLQPILQKAAKDQAISTLGTEIQGVDKFIGSPAYTRALDANPELKQAISVGETNSSFHSRLPGLYKLAYLTAQGMQLPELLKANASQTQTTQSTTQQQAQPVRQTQQVRTTVQPTTANKPQVTAQPTFRTLEGIKATIAAAEAAGATLDF